MNYRHAFHAGNFADVVKHALLVRILAYLQRKETPLRVVDTHAGIGLYDLHAGEAERTGEWVHGIGRLAEPFSPEVEALLAPYRRWSPPSGPPLGRGPIPLSGILREMLRRQDRGVFIELHRPITGCWPGVTTRLPTSRPCISTADGCCTP
jgi:23S rRNA (adenine2030-N6)-methyltransferase